jgi:hypothetical protein
MVDCHVQGIVLEFVTLILAHANGVHGENVTHFVEKVCKEES